MELNGTLPIAVTVEDLVGNRKTYNPGTATLDTLPPGIVDVAFSPPFARGAIPVLLTVTPNELLTDHPALAWEAEPPTGQAWFEPYGRSGLNYTYRLADTSHLALPVYRLMGVTMSDAAGNPVTLSFAEAPTVPPPRFPPSSPWTPAPQTWPAHWF